MAEDLDPIWKALSDSTRRTILDLLRAGPKKTTEIVEAFPEMTRFAVMKHIDVLRSANLINTREEGRQRINSLNAVPIRQIYERWVSPFAELWSNTLLRIKDDVEKKVVVSNRLSVAGEEEPAVGSGRKKKKKSKAKTKDKKPKT